MRHFHKRISELECSCRDLEMRTYELHKTVLDGKTRSMKYNLIFENIVEIFNPDPSIKEETEAILHTFIKEDLNIEDEVKFHNVFVNVSIENREELSRDSLIIKTKTEY